MIGTLMAVMTSLENAPLLWLNLQKRLKLHNHREACVVLLNNLTAAKKLYVTRSPQDACHQWPLINPAKKAKKKSYKNSGILELESITVR